LEKIAPKVKPKRVRENNAAMWKWHENRYEAHKVGQANRGNVAPKVTIVIPNTPPEQTTISKKKVPSKVGSTVASKRLNLKGSMVSKKVPDKKKQKPVLPTMQQSPTKQRKLPQTKPSKKSTPAPKASTPNPKEQEQEDDASEEEDKVIYDDTDSEVSVHNKKKEIKKINEGTSSADENTQVSLEIEELENISKKRRHIAEEDESEEEDIIADEDSLVDHIEPTLAKPKPTVPLFSQPLQVDGPRESRKTAFYQPVQRSPTKSKPASKKRSEFVPILKPNALKDKDWCKIEKTSEIFPRWVPPPSIHGTMYKDFFEPKETKDFDMKDVPKHQRTKPEARNMCSANMARERTSSGFTKVLASIDDEGSKEAYRVWWHQSGNLVEKEANLTYWKNTLYLRFKPATTGKRQRLDGTLHGTYESCVMLEDGGVQVLEVAPDWVEREITKEAKEIIHRVATDWNERHVNIDGRAETGFLTLEGNDDKKEVHKLTDERQISKVRYLPPKTIRTAQNKEKILPERWRGVIRGVNNAPDDFVYLDDDWINGNLSEEFIGFLKSTRKAGTEGYVRIPEGAAEDHTKQILYHESIPDCPKLRYKRSGTIEDNDRSCVLKSAASALSFLGYERIAFYLCNDLDSGMKTDCGFEFFQKCMEPKRLQKKERREFQFAKVKKGLTKWNIFNDSQKYLMCLVGVQSSDHKTDHAVSIAGKWIFDSNFENALPLSKESLDLCCSSDSRKSFFAGVTRVSMLKSMLIKGNN
jgi:hypothetical protein